jgi:uncharacterized protein (DUF849 family)
VDPAAVATWREWPYRRTCVRVLLEVTEDRPRDAAMAEAARLLAALGRDRDAIPVLLHGEGASAWPVFEVAVREGTQVRIGLEDVLVLPDGTPARGNADLVTAGLRKLA